MPLLFPGFINCYGHFYSYIQAWWISLPFNTYHHPAGILPKYRSNTLFGRHITQRRHIQALKHSFIITVNMAYLSCAINSKIKKNKDNGFLSTSIWSACFSPPAKPSNIYLLSILIDIITIFTQLMTFRILFKIFPA